jgi:pilus assembly protein CpaB
VNRRKLLAIGGALTLALVCTFALVRYVKGAESRALAGEELVEVLVAKGDIKAGTSAETLAKSVTAEQVQVKVRAENAVSNFTQIEGLITTVDLVAGEQLLTTRFVNPGSFQGSRSTVRIPEGANEVTFKLSPERALGGQLRPGDTVTVVGSFDPFDAKLADPTTKALVESKTATTSRIIVNRSVVVRIQFPAEAARGGKEKDGVGVAPTTDIFVTLAVDQPSLARAVFAAEFGHVWLSYEPKGAIDTENKVIDRGNVYDPTPTLLKPLTPLIGEAIPLSQQVEDPETPTALLTPESSTTSFKVLPPTTKKR